MQNQHLDSWDLAHRMSSTSHRSPTISSGSNFFRGALLSSGPVMLTTREQATMGGWVMGEASSSGIPSSKLDLLTPQHFSSSTTITTKGAGDFRLGIYVVDSIFACRKRWFAVLRG